MENIEKHILELSHTILLGLESRDLLIKFIYDGNENFQNIKERYLYVLLDAFENSSMPQSFYRRISDHVEKIKTLKDIQNE